MLIYLITNKINGKKYVGQTSQTMRARWRKHQQPYYGYRKNSYLYNSICKYGADNFLVDVLVEVSSKEEMDRYERLLIKALDLRNPAIGYNLTDGGGGMLGFKLSKETRQQMSRHIKSEEHCKNLSIAKMGNKARLGLKSSPETCRRISEALMGKPLSEEHVASLRRGSHRRYHTNKNVINPKCQLCREEQCKQSPPIPVSLPSTTQLNLATITQ